MFDAELPPELSFLREATDTQLDSPYQSASFLRSPFVSNHWVCAFGQDETSIYFNVKLGTGYLTDVEHRQLLNTFKAWICVQEHPSTAAGGHLAPQTMKARVCFVLHLIDYFLLNATAFGLGHHGLAEITRSDIHAMFERLASERDIGEAVYRWRDRLSVYLRACGSALSAVDLDHILAACPEIEEDIPDPVDWMLSLDHREIVLARSYLFKEGLVVRRGDAPFSPRTRQLSRRLYANTLWGVSEKPIPIELVFGRREPTGRELAMSPCRDYDIKRRGDKSLQRYNATLRSLSLLPRTLLNASPHAIRAWDFKSLSRTFNTSSYGRTKTVPVPVVLTALKDAIEFILEYGNAVVDSYVKVCVEATKRDTTCFSLLHAENGSQWFSPHLIALGARAWSVPRTREIISEGQYYPLIRSAPGLWDLLQILVGACFVVISTLMARRQGELSDLVSNEALDMSRRYLVFFNRKSGFLGLREREARPIPSIAVQAVELLQRMHAALARLGLAPMPTYLFQTPSFYGNGLSAPSSNSLYRAVDLFCDYFEIAVDDQGRRYYLRSHQLRRFFAMVFFWHAGFGQMDTLRWFLGHTDIEHLYHYITEVTPGEVLRNVKAQFAADLLIRGDDEAEALFVVVRERFGVDRIGVLDYDELTEYVDNLLREGFVSVDPIFFDDGRGRSYRVAIKVNRRPPTCE